MEHEILTFFLILILFDIFLHSIKIILWKYHIISLNKERKIDMSHLIKISDDREKIMVKNMKDMA
jgi:hypothetical protein